VSRTGEVQLDLQDGFVRDEVIVSADGQEIARATEVTTRTQLGLARSLRLSLAPGSVSLSVAVPRLGLVETTILPDTRPLWIGASLNDARNRLDLRVQTQRFGYA
jgi:hypothetical protein